MIDIETHKIIDLIESRQEDNVTEWLKTYPNLEIISRDGGIMYKSASDKAHPKAKQISDRFHVLKNLTDYARDALKRLLKKQIKIENKNQTQESSVPKKKYESKTKWDLILMVKELRNKKYRVIDVAQYLGISEKTVIEYNKIPLEDKEKYNKISTQELKATTAQKNKWQLIQDVQNEYKKIHKYSVLAKKFDIDERTVKKYLNITDMPIHARKHQEYGSILDKYKKEIIEMNNKGYSWRNIRDTIKEKGYIGSDSLIRHYLAKIKKEVITTGKIEQIVERTTMISLLYKDIENVKNITKEIFDRVIKLFPEADIIYSIIKSFKNIMFSKNPEELDSWIKRTKEYGIQEINSFISGIERDIDAVKNGIKYEYNNGLAEGSVNKIKVIKRIMYGRCSFELLKQKVLLQT